MSCANKLLAYCVLQRSDYEPGGLGVRGSPVRMMSVEGLNCIYSPLVPPQQFEQEDALAAHAVMNAAFSRQAIIPFRFPTILQNEADLETHLREKHAVYSSDMERLRDLVQMELRISEKEANTASAKSGTEYLQSKRQHSRDLQEASKKAREGAKTQIIEWRVRPMDHGLRCYALVKRGDISQLRALLEGFANNDFNVKISGPWPATEFLHE